MSSMKTFLPPLLIKKCPNCGQQISLCDAVPIAHKRPHPCWYELSEQRLPRKCPFCRMSINLSRLTYAVGISAIAIPAIWMGIKPIGIYYSNISGVFITVFLWYFLIRTGKIILAREQDTNSDSVDGDHQA